MASTKNDPRYRKLFVVMLILLVVASAIVRWRLDPPPISDASPGAFNATQAVKTLTMVLGDEQPHPVDSSAQNQVRHRIIAALQSMGYAVNVQDTTSCNDHWGATCARIRNLTVTSPGTAAGKPILLMAHYDSVPAGPGASDDGSGVVALMEIARLLKSRPRGRNPVILLFTDGEEAGLLGAKAFAESDPRAGNIALVINVESRGTSGQSVMFQTGHDSGWLVGTYASAAQRPLTNSLLSAVYNLMPNDTDFTVFRNEGIPGLNFAFGEHFPFYHTPKDNLQSLDLRTLQQQGDNAYRIVSALRDADLAAEADATAANLVYTDILGLGVIRWPTSWSLGVLIALLALFGFAGIGLKRRYNCTTGSVALGFAGFFLVLVLAAVSAWLLSSAMALLHAPGPAWHSSAPGNRVLLWSVVLLAGLCLPRLLTRRSDPLGLLLGTGLAWLLAGLATALLLPALTYLFLVPSLILVVFALLATASRGVWADYARLALFIAPVLAAFIVIFPAVYIVEVLIRFSLPGVIGMGAFLGLAVTLLLPLTASGESGRTHLYAGAALVIFALIGAGLSLGAPAYNAERPQALNISYIQDAAGHGHVFTASKGVPLPVALKQVMGADGAYRKVLPWSNKHFYSVPVDYARLPAPDLTILENRKIVQGHEMVLQLDAGPAIQRLTLLVPKAAGLISAEMDGHIMSYQGLPSDRGQYQSFVCRGESCDGRQVTLTMTRKPSIPLLLVKATAGVPHAAEPITQGRNASGAVPISNGDETLIVSSIPLQPDEITNH